MTCPSNTECENDPTESYKIENVCDLTKRNKLFLCKAMLRLNYFGLQFDMTRKEDIPCNLYKISLKHRPIHELATDELEMFQCPRLKYIDLATDEPVFLLIKFFISSTNKPQSFFLHIQENPNRPIYPHKFASEVIFSKLHLMRDNLTINEKPDQLEAGEMSLFSSAKLAQKRVSEFFEITKFSNGKQMKLILFYFYTYLTLCDLIPGEVNATQP